MPYYCYLLNEEKQTIRASIEPNFKSVLSIISIFLQDIAYDYTDIGLPIEDTNGLREDITIANLDWNDKVANSVERKISLVVSRSIFNWGYHMLREIHDVNDYYMNFTIMSQFRRIESRKPVDRGSLVSSLQENWWVVNKYRMNAQSIIDPNMDDYILYGPYRSPRDAMLEAEGLSAKQYE